VGTLGWGISVWKEEKGAAKKLLELEGNLTAADESAVIRSGTKKRSG
jgi:hypothetical protein